jgi:hypothetical protein
MRGWLVQVCRLDADAEIDDCSVRPESFIKLCNDTRLFVYDGESLEKLLLSKQSREKHYEGNEGILPPLVSISNSAARKSPIPSAMLPAGEGPRPEPLPPEDDSCCC